MFYMEKLTRIKIGLYCSKLSQKKNAQKLLNLLMWVHRHLETLGIVLKKI